MSRKCARMAAEVQCQKSQYCASIVDQEAERLGCDSVWLYDHFHTVPQPTLNTTFECWVSTAALARDTQTICLGQMVGCNGYRHPAGSVIQVMLCSRSYAIVGRNTGAD